MVKNIVDLYTRAVASFGETLQHVSLDSWEKRTPCDDWTIQTLVVHVLSGEVHLMNLVEDETYSSPELSPNILGPDPMSTWRGTAINAIRVAQDTPLGKELPHPTVTLTLERLLGARITDNAVHAWDLSQALSLNHVIDPEVAEWALDYWANMYDFLSQSEHFGPPQNPPDQTPSTRLLSLLGRTVT